MAKKKQEEAPKGSPAWMATFSDLMNLLLCFFVLLFSMSSVDAAKWEEVVTSMTSAFSIFSDGSTSIGDGNLVGVGTSQLSNLDEYYSSYGQSSVEDGEDDKSASDGTDKDVSDSNNDIESDDKGQNPGQNTSSSGDQGEKPDKGDSDTEGDKELNQSDKETLEDMLAQAGREETEEMLDEIAEMTEQYNIYGDLDLSMDSAGKYVQITLSGSMLFDSGSANLRKECLPLLAKVGDILNVYRDHSVNVIGHTDNVPMKSAKFDSNEILSSARAISTAMYLVESKNIDIKRLSWTGRGEFEPVASNATAAGRAQNRRVEIRIYNSLNSD